MNVVATGRPAMTSELDVPVSRPLVGAAELRAVAAVLRSGWLTQGRQVEAFECEFANYVGAAHACAVSSCTAALHLALRAVGVGPGDEVLTVSHSFIATANAICHCGATPVFLDIDPRTYDLDPARLEAAITHRTRAVLPVHQLGLPCDMEPILEVARRHGLPVVEDAACAIGSELKVSDEWQRIGRPHGDIACFSFHPRKVLTTGDGGMLTTNDAGLDQRFRSLRQHAMSVTDMERHEEQSSGRLIFETYGEVGFNYRMTDVQAAIGREQLRRLPHMLADRRRLADRYTRQLRSVSGLLPPVRLPDRRANYQSYAIRLTPRFPLSRDELMQQLLRRGIQTRRGVMNAHQEPAFAHLTPTSLQCSEAARDEVILLPLYAGMTSLEQDRVLNALAELAALPHDGRNHSSAGKRDGQPLTSDDPSTAGAFEHRRRAAKWRRRHHA